MAKGFFHHVGKAFFCFFNFRREAYVYPFFCNCLHSSDLQINYNNVYDFIDFFS